MARQVYFDPFGSYVNGYDTGLQRQMQLEGATRNARREDAMFPLYYREAQRRDEIGAYALPGMKQLADFGVRNARTDTFRNEAGAAKDFGSQIGVTAPFENLLNDYFKFNTQTTNRPSIPNMPLYNARLEYNRGVSQLPMPQGQGDPIDQFQLAQSDLGRQIAAQYGVPLPDVMANDQRPDLQPVQAQGTDYYMTGPNGQPVRVGGMVDPRASLLEQWQRPEVMAEVARRYQIQQDAIEQQHRARQSAIYGLQTQINYGNYLNGGGGEDAVPDY